MTEHTATPWVFKVSASKRLAFVETENREYQNFSRIVEISKQHNPNFEGDAAFIVRACNAHDDLLAACKAALQYIEDNDLDTCGCEPADYSVGILGSGLCSVCQLRAAIAAAEEAPHD